MSLEDHRKQRLNDLEDELGILQEKLKRLRNAARIETDAARTFQLEHQINDAEQQREGLEQEIATLEETLAQGASKKKSESPPKYEIHIQHAQGLVIGDNVTGNTTFEHDD